MLNPFSAKAGRDVSSACANDHPTAGSWGDTGVVGELLLLWGSTVGVPPWTPELCYIIPGNCWRWGGRGGCISWVTRAIDSLLDLPLYPSQRLPVLPQLPITGLWLLT